jgi:hypothetical protein
MHRSAQILESKEVAGKFFKDKDLAAQRRAEFARIISLILAG